MAVLVSRETHIAIKLDGGGPMTAGDLAQFADAVRKALPDGTDLRQVKLRGDCDVRWHHICVSLEVAA